MFYRPAIDLKKILELKALSKFNLHKVFQFNNSICTESFLLRSYFQLKLKLAKLHKVKFKDSFANKLARSLFNFVSKYRCLDRTM